MPQAARATVRSRRGAGGHFLIVLLGKVGGPLIVHVVPAVTSCPLHWGFGPDGGDDGRPYLGLRP